MKVKIFAAALLCLCFFAGCSKNEEKQGSGDAPAVSTVTMELKDREDFLTYNGYIAADEQKKYSFELGGTISQIYVEKGDEVKKGQILAELDTKAVNLAIRNAKENIEKAQNAIKQCDDGIETAQIAVDGEKTNLQKIQTGIEAEKINLQKIKDNYESGINQIQLKYDNAKKVFEDTKTMYEGGVVSQNDYDNAKLAYDTAAEELNKNINAYQNDVSLEEKQIETMEQNYTLQEQNIAAKQSNVDALRTKKEAAQIELNQARIALDENQKHLDDSVLKATMDGFVIELPLKAGEVTGAGTPVVVVKSSKQVVNIGLPAEDYGKVSPNMPAIVEMNGVKTTGKVESIELYPNEASRTYNMKISYNDDLYAIGSLVSVSIPLSSSKVYTVPISAVCNIDGLDYVYFINEENGKKYAKLCRVTLGKIIDDNVEVEGVSFGMQVIKSGIKNISENAEVTVTGE